MKVGLEQLKIKNVVVWPVELETTRKHFLRRNVIYKEVQINRRNFDILKSFLDA